MIPVLCIFGILLIKVLFLISNILIQPFSYPTIRCVSSFVCITLTGT